MGGKGRRRREKNYLAAHGGPGRLPPPPHPSQVDALPSKLRKLISFTSTLDGSDKIVKNDPDEKGNSEGHADARKKHDGENESKRESIGIKNGGDDEMGHIESGDDKTDNRKKKRKRKEVKDLRFLASENSGTHSKRKERKKKYLEAKKKRHKKAKTEEDLDFPGCEKVEFGDVVEAPPKLVTVAKALKTDASKERLRLQAIEAYRSRKGWTSRPGLQLPPASTSPPL